MISILKSLFAIVLFASLSALQAQTFTNATDLLGASFNSGGCVGVTDMNNDGFDDIIVLHNARHLRVLYQTPAGWELVEYGTVSGNNQWGMAIGDISETGHRDVVCGGSYDGVHHVRITDVGEYETSALANGSMFMQACNVVDIDNDGHLDFFACHDDALSRMWRNNGSGSLVPANDLIDLTDYDTGAFPNTDHSGNYGSVWSDIDDDGHLDLVIAKCRQFVSNPFDPRRINQAWMNDGNGNFTEEALNRGLVLYEQSWTVDFADVNNDGFFDCLITNHTGTMRLLLNDGNGFFEDVTESAGLAVSGFFLQAKMVDFDNDGWVDLVYSGGVHRYYRNNGDGTFTDIPSMFPYSDTMHSFGIGDLNKDGFLDVYASYGNTYVNPDPANPDILWMNDGNDNNWIAFDLEGTMSNSDAIGAKIKLYGEWGVQVREVRSGESYGIVNSFHLNFGIGQNTEVEMAVITWPSGTITVIENPGINTYHQVIEGNCMLEGIMVEANGTTELCPDESVVISAPEGYSYLWSNGETTGSIDVNASGFYSVIAFDNDGCAGGSNAIGVTVIQPIAPVITVNGELEFCEGDEAELVSSPGTSYAWSNGAESQSITISESGAFTVTVVDVCESGLTSEIVEIIVNDTPDLPILPELVDANSGVLSLDLQDGVFNWYAKTDCDGELFYLTSGSSIDYTGEELIQILGNLPACLCIEEEVTYGGTLASGGRVEASEDGGQFHFNSNFWPRFDAHTDLILESVKVYAGTSGPRTIALINSSNTVIDQVTVDISAITDDFGEVLLEAHEVSLNFEVPEGENYGLRCLDGNPQLWRDGPPAAMGYPYQLGELATITTSSVSGANALAFYYFFYDWKVSTPSVVCTSDMVCSDVSWIVSVQELSSDQRLRVFPNPARDLATLEIDGFAGEVVRLQVFDATGRRVIEHQISVHSSVQRFELNVAHLSSGMYTLNLTNGTRQVNSRILVD